MTTRVLSLAKGDQKYIFRYTPGSEDQVVDEIMRLADDPETNLDWLDAATLGFQVAHYTALGCTEAIQTAARKGGAGSANPGANDAPADPTTDGPCANHP